MEIEYIFTTENLLNSFGILGPWSTYHLADMAISHYHEECEDMTEPERTVYQSNLKCDGKENTSWEDWIEKYHKEIGYTKEQLSDKDYVNER